MELQEAPQEGRTWLWPQPKKLALISELDNPFPAGWWLPIGPVLRPTAAPITASHQPVSPSPASLYVSDSSYASELGQTSPDLEQSRDQ